MSLTWLGLGLGSGFRFGFGFGFGSGFGLPRPRRGPRQAPCTRRPSPCKLCTPSLRARKARAGQRRVVRAMGREEGPSPARAARAGDSPIAAAGDRTRDRTTATLAPTPRGFGSRVRDARRRHRPDPTRGRRLLAPSPSPRPSSSDSARAGCGEVRVVRKSRPAQVGVEGGAGAHGVLCHAP